MHIIPHITVLISIFPNQESTIPNFPSTISRKIRKGPRAKNQTQRNRKKNLDPEVESLKASSYF